MDAAVTSTDLPFPKRSGKVRDVYDLGGDRLLIVATDRVSAYDVVMPNGVPGKGVLLTRLARFWFDRLADLVPNHLIGGDLPAGAADLADRSMLVRKLEIVPFECVARGYLAGSGWAEYEATGRVCGVGLPAGLRRGGRLFKPIFTPATKATSGHDENVSFDRMADEVGGELAALLRDRTLGLYRAAHEYAFSRGVIIADTKLEWGRDAGGTAVLADEAFTPDSSRFWPADDHRPGREQPSFDKQFVRDHLSASGWDRRPPAPPLPEGVIAGTLDRYRDAVRRLTGQAA